MGHICSLVLFVLAGFKGIQAITVSTPVNVAPCDPIAFLWSGGTGPYTLTIQTTNAASNIETLSYPNIPSTAASYVSSVYFPSGSVVTAIVEDGTGTQGSSDPFTLQSGSDVTCLNSFLPGSSSSSTPSIPLTLDQPTDSVSICQLSLIEWSGGIAPYSATVQTVNLVQEVAQGFSNINANSIETILQMSASSIVEIFVVDGRGQNITSPHFSVNPTSNTTCVLQNLKNASATPNSTIVSSMSSTLTPHPSNPSIKSGHPSTIVIVTVTAIVVLVVAGSIWYVRRRGRSKKRRGTIKLINDTADDPSTVAQRASTLEMGQYRPEPFVLPTGGGRGNGQSSHVRTLTGESIHPTVWFETHAGSSSCPSILPTTSCLEEKENEEGAFQEKTCDSGPTHSLFHSQASSSSERSASSPTVSSCSTGQTTEKQFQPPVFHVDGGPIEQVEEFPPAYQDYRT